MPRKAWMYTGDTRHDIVYELRPGVTADRYAKPNDMLWRYMPLDRLAEIIATGEIFFTRLSTNVRNASDEFEGSSPRYVPDIMQRLLAERGQLEHEEASAKAQLQPERSPLGV